jgi:hypothetical protein
MHTNTQAPSSFGKSEHERLEALVAASAIRVAGHQEVYDLAQIRVMVALLESYGDSTRGFLYAEPTLLDAQIPPPDIVLAHPRLGVLVVECKAYEIDYIEGMEAGNLKIQRYGQQVQVNPLRQGQRAMFAIKDAYELMAQHGTRPLFHTVVALPNIREVDWMRRQYHHCIDARLILFAEHIEDGEKLRERLNLLIQDILRRTGRSSPLPSTTEPVLLRVFGDSSVIETGRDIIRDLEAEPIGHQIEILERVHKQLSAEQRYLVQQDTWGHPFLVRGVAGSGKSIVLAHQVARTIHRHQQQQAQLPLFEDAVQPTPRIGVVCFNRTLVSLLRSRIAGAYQVLTGEELTEDESLLVIHLNRLLYQISQTLGEPYFRYIRANRGHKPAERARHHLHQLERLRAEYPVQYDKICFDGLFIDEGQDARSEEYGILHALVRPDASTGERSITIFYDDAQNLHGHPPPVWRNLSMNVAGNRAAFMQHCHRNSREILELGLNVLLGTRARQTVRVATRRFSDIALLEEKGLVTQTEAGWRVQFAEATGRQPVVKGFLSRAEQLDWVADAVVSLLEEEQVKPHHILIMASRSSSFRHLGQRINQLAREQIAMRMVGGLYQEHLDELLTVDGQLTLSTIHAAKGYDAPVVFMVDVDQIDRDVLGRALFYVGVTRARRYLVLSGIDRPQTLLREALDVQAALKKIDT